MNIKFKDIESIISGLCCANAMLDAKIDYKARKEKLKDSLNALTKIRKELHLKDDYAYEQVFGE